MTALTPLEVASGLLLPRTRPRPPLPDPGMTPRAGFERAILPALRRRPCLVSFSGGRDSSAVLAAAAHLARREGLPLPVPLTHRFPSATLAQESEWQEQVVRHLGLEDWIRLDAGDDLDCLGPVATASLRRHGLLWPCNAYFHSPVFEAAAGGAVLTGVGGDEAFAGSSWGRALAVLGGRARPEPRDALRIGFALAPAAVKRSLMRRWLPELYPWLRPAARRAVERSVAAEAAGEPLRWRARFRHVLGSPYMDACLASLATLGGDHGVAVVHPFHDAAFLAALAALPRERRHRSRAEAMAALVGDLLPAELVSRSTKARFDAVFWTERSLALAREWDGDGVDPEIVDVDRLRAEWAAPTPDSHTITLLQSVWLRRDRAAAARPPAASPSPAAG